MHSSWTLSSATFDSPHALLRLRARAGKLRSSTFAPKIVPRARARAADIAPDAETAPGANTVGRHKDIARPSVRPATTREVARGRDVGASPSSSQHTGTTTSGVPTIGPGKSRLRAASTTVEDTTENALVLAEPRRREEEPTVPNEVENVPTAAAPSSAVMPPAHRWVRTAATTKGNRVGSSSRTSNAAPTDETLARSIRDIIRQRSREERAAEARARVAKRRNEDGSTDAADGSGAKRSGVGASTGADSKALALMGIPVEEAARETEAAPQAIAPAVDPGSVSMTPQVLVVNGQIVINEKSLTVNAAVERATALSDFTRVEESGTKLNSATYANYTKAEKWTREDTEFFFQALRQFGTDFSLIQRLFPNRSRRQIKKKYLVEDKLNPDRVEEAIKNLNPDTTLYQNLIDVLKTPDSHVEPEGGLARAVLDKLPAPEEVDVADRQEMKMRTTRGRGKR